MQGSYKAQRNEEVSALSLHGSSPILARIGRLVKWHNFGLQNRRWGFDSLIARICEKSAFTTLFLREDGNRKTERDGASRGRVNFHQKITRDRFPSSPAVINKKQTHMVGPLREVRYVNYSWKLLPAHVSRGPFIIVGNARCLIATYTVYAIDGTHRIITMPMTTAI